MKALGMITEDGPPIQKQYSTSSTGGILQPLTITQRSNHNRFQQTSGVMRAVEVVIHDVQESVWRTLPWP